MAKRGLCILLAVVTLFALAAPAFAAEEASPAAEKVTAAVGDCGGEGDGTNLGWTLSSDGVLTISGTGKMKDYEWKGAPWYDLTDQIKKIVIKNGVTSIGQYTFYSCTSLTSVTIPEGVTSIGESAFSSCVSLTSVTIPGSVTSIGESAFFDCRNLKSVAIPEGVTSIGLNAFFSCVSLTSVTVPASVTSLDPHAFNASGIKDISVAKGNKNYTVVDNVLFSKDKTELIWYASGKTASTYAVPNTVKTIDPGAFTNNDYLKSLTISASVTSIANSSISNKYLTSISVAKDNKNYASVNGVLFSKDKETLICYPRGKTASTYAVPNTVVAIADNAFSGSTALTSVTIPNGVISIGRGAFFDCNSLTSVTIPASVVSIDNIAFGGCENLNIKILNPDCDIYPYEGAGTLGYSWTTVISGYDGSTAETFAKEYGYTFKSLGKAPDTSKPTELTAPTVKISQTDSGIKVTWNKVEGSARYMVYYKENGGGWKKIGTTDKTSYTRAASKLKAGATYQFAVRCCASDKKTLLSGYKASNKVKYVPELAAPTVKISQTKSGIKVTWNKVSGSDRYMVYYKQNGGKWQKIGTTAKTSYTRAAKYLKAGATYQFAVRCCASDGKTLLSTYKASNKVKFTK